MQLSTKRSILFLTVPVFPIAVERALNKRLCDRPLVLVRNANPRARCLAVSFEAQRLGVRRGMTLSEIRRVTREVEVLYPDPILYKRASAAIQNIISEYSPLVEPIKSGQNFIDLTGSERLFGSVNDIAATLRKRFQDEIRLPAEAGIAVNKLVSRVAAFDAAPEGLLRVEYGSEEPFLEPHRVAVLPSVDRDIQEQLIELNINLIQQIKTIDIELLLIALGPVAFTLSRHARGVDPEPVVPPTEPPRIAVAEELKEDSNDRSVLLACASRLVIEGVSRLHKRLATARELILTVLYSDGQNSTDRIKLRKASDSTTVWLSIVQELLDKVVTRRIRIRRIELTFTSLNRAEKQLEIWSDFQSDSESSRNSGNIYRMDRVLNTMEKIRERFGEKSLTLGLAA